MQRFQFYCGGRLVNLRTEGLAPVLDRSPRTAVMGRLPRPALARAVRRVCRAQPGRLADRFATPGALSMQVSETQASRTGILPTESVAIGGARTGEINWLRDRYGMTLVKEGLLGKVLVRVPEDTKDRVAVAFKASQELYERQRVTSAHPNFLRLIRRPRASATAAVDQWNLDNSGDPGTVGADVHALAAWTITEGSASVRVAILDEGVDSTHPALREVLVREKDFVDGNRHARPDGDDAHGTACAGIVGSQSSKVWGLATGCRLVSARIAKGDGGGYWVFDDFDTADAIDWCWRDALADVLSNSWGGGPPVDIITQAIRRAHTQGRGGLGSVVVAAAGNDQKPVDFPGTVAGVLTVGASNQWDQRKTRNSRDREDWGSNYGDELDLIAPGVSIWTTDIRGNRGYSGGSYTARFNGTSAATPHVAAAAALVLSVRGDLSEKQVRRLIVESCDPPCAKRSRLVGYGRLNVYRALRASLARD